MKRTVLIVEQIHGSTRPVEIVANAPISMIVPALVEELRLPKREANGDMLHYSLRLTAQGDALPDEVTLSSAGIEDGTTLTLDAEKPQGIATQYDFLAPLSLTLSNSAYSSTSNGNSLHSATTLSDDDAFSMGMADVGRNELRPYGSGQTRKRSFTRRAFLGAGVAALGIGMAGAGYAAYRSFKGNLNVISTMTMQSTAPMQKNAPKTTLPTMAQRVMSFTGHQQTVRTVSWSPSGAMLASGADDAQLLIWQTNGNITRSVPHPAAVRALAWSPDGGRIVTGSNNQVLFLSVSTNTVLGRSTHRHVGTVAGLAWTSHNQQFQVVSAGLDMRAFVWDTTRYRSQLLYARHTAPIDAIAWAMDGQTVATSSHGGAVRVWNVLNGQDVHSLYYVPNTPLRAAGFAPNSNTLAVGGDDGLVRLWDGLICQQIAVTNAGQTCVDMPQQLRVSQRAVRALAWSPDGNYLATGSDDGVLSLWQPSRSLQPLFRVTVQQGVPIYSVSWSPKGDQIATAIGNHVVLWKVM